MNIHTAVDVGKMHMISGGHDQFVDGVFDAQCLVQLLGYCTKRPIGIFIGKLSIWRDLLQLRRVNVLDTFQFERVRRPGDQVVRDAFTSSLTRAHTTYAEGHA